MQLTERRAGNAVLLRVSGRVDSTTADDLSRGLQPYLEACKPGGNIVVLDFSTLEYISSAGFRVLLVAQRKAKTQEGAFAVAALGPSVRALFDIANFGSVIRNYGSVRDALAELSQSALAAYEKNV